jgi:hypothetical protein
MVICYTNYWPSTVPVITCYTSSFIYAWVTNSGGYFGYSPYLKISYAESWTATGGYVWITRNIGEEIYTATNFTEIVTNTIGWHIDRDMLVSLDSTIKALVPYYCDANTVYDGTTNIVMLTVTGLWASLQIGDGTNKFTREPAWTNPVSTNWIVSYTSYWPSTSGVATNINYTSDYRQAVNYASSWTATGGHVWVTSSNWASQVAQTTNQATYGDYPWQIYTEDLQERYKVLNALKVLPINTTASYLQQKYLSTHDSFTNAWSLTKTRAENTFSTSDYQTVSTPGCYGFTQGISNGDVNIYSSYLPFAPSNPFGLTSVVFSFQTFIYAFKYVHTGYENTYDDNGLGLPENTYTLINSFPFGLEEHVIPVWCDQPSTTGKLKGFGGIIHTFLNFDFQYCTNKYW